MPISVMLMAMLYCTWNGVLQASYLVELKEFPKQYEKTPQFLIGVVVFFIGFTINYQSDGILRNLRKPGETGYKIPHGGLFEYVSGANFFGVSKHCLL